MKVEVNHNDQKDGVELLFSEELPKTQATRLKDLGFKQAFREPLKWYAKKHPAYNKYAEELKTTLSKGETLESVPIRPSFEAVEENIDHNKFSYVTISYREDALRQYESFVIFDSYKNVAMAIATSFGKNKYKEHFLEVDVYPRNYKRKARSLLDEDKVITGDEYDVIPEEKPIHEVKEDGSESNASKSNTGNHIPDSHDEEPSLDQTSNHEEAHDFNNIIHFSKKVTEQMAQEMRMPVSYANAVKILHLEFLKEEFFKLEEPTVHDVKRIAEKILILSGEDKRKKTNTSEITWELTPLEYQQERAFEKTGSTMVLDARDRQEHEGIVKQALEEGKEVPQKVLDHYPWLIEQEQENATNKYDYIDRVIAYMHEKYANGERPTKKQIETIAKELEVPNMGMMWEATELSWLLWYKNIYHQKIPFEDRLAKMIHFWNKLQPTYAYSDSSKEIYKQYSTPCPIGAIIAQYTGMDAAGKIFEPSAGNGLLLVGADPSKTHVNEIDPTRLASLKFQAFQKVTQLNAIEPFPDQMEKQYDVVVTNPPFAKWEEEKFDKDVIVRKYFNKHVGLEKHIRLEHLMAGLALYSMKDTGKAAIIIMGHLYFEHDGFIAKYRPFFNWLFRHYQVDDVINMNSFKLYNKQGAVEKTMLILVGGRKSKPTGVAPTKQEAPHLQDMVNSFSELWDRVKGHMHYNLETIIQQLEITLAA